MLLDTAPPLVLVTAVSDHLKQRARQTFARFGIEVKLGSDFDLNTTHLISGEPARSEKFLSACARGAWVVRPSYIDACAKAGKMVAEEPYEWTSEYAKRSESRQLAATPRRWRLELQRRRQLEPSLRGAFDGWVAALFTRRSHIDGFRRLLEAGGAVVHMTQRDLRASDAQHLTHVFVQSHQLDKHWSNLQDFMTVAKNNVECLMSGYIADFLVHTPPPKPGSARYDDVDLYAKIVREQESNQRRIGSGQPSTKRSKH